MTKRDIIAIRITCGILATFICAILVAALLSSDRVPKQDPEYTVICDNITYTELTARYSQSSGYFIDKDGNILYFSGTYMAKQHSKKESE